MNPKSLVWKMGIAFLAAALLLEVSVLSASQAKAQEQAPPPAVAQDAPSAPAPVLRLYYYAEGGERIEEVRALFHKAAEAAGLPYAEYDIGDEEVFRGLLRLEEEREIHRYANLELFAGPRYFAGVAEIVPFLEGLAAGKESLKPPEPPHARSREVPPGRQAPEAGPGIAEGTGGFRSEVVRAQSFEQVIGLRQRVGLWFERIVRPNRGVVLGFLVGLAAGLAVALVRRRRSSPLSSP